VAAGSGSGCAGFGDVERDSAFCGNVDWMFNRSITLGCAAGSYCPGEAVSRLAMAAFQNRLGTSVAPAVVAAQQAVTPLDLDAAPIVCQVDVLPQGFTRTVGLDSVLTGTAGADAGVAIDLMVTLDGGASWQAVAAQGQRGFVRGSHWANLRAVAHFDLAASQGARFGLAVRRDELAGSEDLTEARCRLRATVGNRNSTFAPYDAAP
jgi:hypothetical protein